MELDFSDQILAKRGLWENIRRKRERIKRGSKEKMRKPGEKGAFKAMPTISNVTAFNTDPFNTFKSAFRECTKLAAKVIDKQKDHETEQRLNVWCSVGSDKGFGEYAIAGAIAGREYGEANKTGFLSPRILRHRRNTSRPCHQSMH